MFFLKLLTNKDVIHINFHSPQALPTPHLLLADFVGTSDPRQEWQTQHLPYAEPQAAWRCPGLQTIANLLSEQSVSFRHHGISCFMNSSYSLQYMWVEQAAPKVGTVHREPGEGMGLGFLLAKAASPCLLPQITCGRSKVALFCPCRSSPSSVGHWHPLEKHTCWLLLTVDLCSSMQRAMRSAWTVIATFFMFSRVKISINYLQNKKKKK